MPVCCLTGPFLLVIGSATLAAGVKRYLLFQRINNTPTSKVRSAAVGLVELFGKAKCKDDVLSPISKVKSAFWRVTGEYYYKTKKSSGWREFFKKESGVPFYLQDPTGKMLVDPKGGEVDIPHDFQVKGHLKDFNLFGIQLQKKMDKKVLDFIYSDSKIQSKFSNYSGRRLRISEYYIAEGDPLYVMGSATPTKEGSAVAHENLVMKKGPIEGILYISDSHEKKLTGRMKWSMLGLLFFGLVLTVAGLVLTLVSFGVLALFGD